MITFTCSNSHLQDVRGLTASMQHVSHHHCLRYSVCRGVIPHPHKGCHPSNARRSPPCGVAGGCEGGEVQEPHSYVRCPELQHLFPGHNVPKAVEDAAFIRVPGEEPDVPERCFAQPRQSPRVTATQPLHEVSLVHVFRVSHHHDVHVERSPLLINGP